MHRQTLVPVLASFVTLAVFLAPLAPGLAAPQERATDALHRPLDGILDLYVRDGLVYYPALRSERGRLDRYLASLDVPPADYDRWPRERRMAFWVNAYNAFVLRTVIDHYPIGARTADYPADSIRQIPGAFERLKHRAAGRSVTLDEIEKTILPEFEDPRLYLALGRGAVGSGRLRSEAYDPSRIEQQLDAVQAEFVNEASMLRVDRAANTISVTPIVSWNAERFIAAYDTGETGPFARRSPIERAVIAFISPHLLPLERDLVQGNAFTMTYHDFDWRLNDLTGR